MDALTQLIEAFVSKRSNPLTDSLCRDGIKRVARSLRTVYFRPDDAGARSDMSSVVHASNGSAIVSTAGHTPGKVRTFKGQLQRNEDVVWAHPQPESDPYQNEWDDLIDAIINDKPYNEVPRGVQASQVSNMGRMAAHTGQEITYEQMVNCPHEFAPNVDKLTEDGPAPVQANVTGRYPVPEPGIKNDREY